jgi:membrane protein YdbS with pleckstrin-like domain
MMFVLGTTFLAFAFGCFVQGGIATTILLLAILYVGAIMKVSEYRQHRFPSNNDTVVNESFD